MFVQFSDATETTIIAVFGSVQNAEEYPNQGTVEVSDARWATYFASVPASIQASLIPPTTPLPPSAAQTAQNSYNEAIAAGVQITSAGTPSLSGTYSLSDSAQSKITSEQVYIATTGKFTNGQTSRAWPDIANAPHTFPTTAEFTAFAEAVAQYVDALTSALALGLAGGAWVAPAQPAALP